jgi:D-glycero-D-manno-heptose 1,7-bisphosphate phosphatase
MILRAAKEHSLDLRHSVLVGDKVSDIEAGRAARVGCCVLVLTGHPLSAADAGRADNVFAGLRDVANAFASNRNFPGQ